MFLITSLTVTRSRIVRTKYVSSIPITSLPAYFAYRLEYAHALNYTIDIEFCQFIHNFTMEILRKRLDNNKKVMYNKNETKQSEIHRDSQY